ncbi:MAG: hypothetical protein F6K26_35160 [Moorea sp. SIO2I5]|nr:hypothetical protein [Moorena sp. SIO2I5]
MRCTLFIKGNSPDIITEPKPSATASLLPTPCSEVPAPKSLLRSPCSLNQLTNPQFSHD